MVALDVPGQNGQAAHADGPIAAWESAKRRRPNDGKGDAEVCVLCRECLSPQRWRPFMRAAFTDGEVRLCHFWCVRRAMKGREDKKQGASDADGAQAYCLAAEYVEEVRALLAESPVLYNSSEPCVRICKEEERLNRAARGAPLPLAPLAPPPSVSWSFEWLIEVRISACPALQELPPDVGRIHGMRSLVLISNSLLSLPSEIGELKELQQVFINGNFLRTVPEELGQLPNLSELCLDANQLERIPPLTSMKLDLVSAPANKLTALPPIAGRPKRIEFHGNQLPALAFNRDIAYFDSMITLKVMGNQLTELPPEVALMRSLRILHAAENRLRTLPESLGCLDKLEWLLLYGNALEVLPAGLIRGKRMERALLEGNPLVPEAVLGLIEDVGRPASTLKTLGLDDEQVRRAVLHGLCGEDGRPLPQPLPAAVSVGQVVPCTGQYALKLTRASHLRRSPGVAALGEDGGDGPPGEKPAELLVVAFAASQGEPEWLGFLRRVATSGCVAELPALCGPLSALLAESGCQNDKAQALIKLWANTSNEPAAGGASLKIDDFDVLSIVDHRMRWYSEDMAGLHSTLEEVTRRYRCTLFLGASMGGFGAMLHGGRLADAVLALGPQAALSEATLRPPSPDVEGLRSLEKELQASLLCARERGAAIRVHCAADEHFWHALALPLEDFALTVHPFVPRKPFARLLDNAGLLAPIIEDAIHHALSKPASKDQALSRLPSGSDGAANAACDSEVAVARWAMPGPFPRHSAGRRELLALFFGEGAPTLPRPGDWFCPKCSVRNMQASFFCCACKGGDVDASCLNAKAPRVRGGRIYPKKGDWGCRNCGSAMTWWDKTCTHCGSACDGCHAHVVE